MEPKKCIVTGANSGIGFAVTKGLLASGHFVIMACRNLQRGEEARKRLISETGKNSVELLELDLSSVRSVRRFAKNINEKAPTVDVLAQCAGHVSFERSVTEEGTELNFATNVLGPYLLSRLLVPNLSRSTQGRIINIAGEFHRFYSLDLDDLMYEKKFSPLRVGSLSMLERIMLTYDLAEELRQTNITVNCFHPGNVRTEMMDKLPTIVRKLSFVIRPFQLSPDEGADTCIWLALEGQGVTGKYFIKRKEVHSSKASYDRDVQQKLKESCLKMFNAIDESGAMPKMF